MPGPLTITAPAKINLYLHVTGRRADGYHTLESLVVFADRGDVVDVAAADGFSFAARGPFAAAIPMNDDNLVVRAVRGLAALLDRAADCTVTLTKNLPVAAGVGGGSADAAAAVRGLLRLWDVAPGDVAGLDDFLLALGADVPVCFAGRAAVMRGIGEEVTPLDLPRAIPALLVNPLVLCPTADVFARRAGDFSTPGISFDGSLTGIIKSTRNDLTDAACMVAPPVATVLAELAELPGVMVARMSGSGATCFALFETDAQARAAEGLLRAQRPGWWMTAVSLNDTPLNEI